jgi:putative nucleotidyltransferase with HDIG domain
VKQIMFVDDEPNVLDGLRVSLRKYRHEWNMEFAPGGLQALALLAERTFDVVVTDLRMPEVDGLTLLKHLREHHPQTIRVVLSGDPGRASVLAAVPFAHQSLTKPCRVGELEAMLARASMLGALISDPDVRSAVGRVDELPSLPVTYARLLRLFEDEKACTADVAAVIGSDIAVTAKILQLANSAFFGSGRQITTVFEAVPLMGWETVKALTLSTEVFAARGLAAPVRLFAERLHEHSLVVAMLATELVEEADRRPAFAAGMLHDIGRLILASAAPEEMDGTPGAGALATRHAKVGAYLLGLWGLPPAVIDAVARHHDPDTSAASAVGHAVALAEQSVDDAEGEAPSASAIAEMRSLVRQQVAALAGSS